MLVCGNIREGKTIFLMYLSWCLHVWNMAVPENLRVPIYSNFTIKYPEVQKIEVDKLLDLEGITYGFMPLSELYTWLESRVSSSLLSRYVSYFIFQSGKRGVDVCGDAQLGSTVDLRFFELSHILAIARKNEVERKFTYQFAVRCGVGVKMCSRDLSFDTASKFWNDYDTHEPVKPVGLENLQFEMDKHNYPKINARVDAIVDKILSPEGVYYVNGQPCKFASYVGALGWIHSQGKAVYQYQVEDLLLRMFEPPPLAKMVTNRLKVHLSTS